MADNIRRLPIKRRGNEHVETPLEPFEEAAMIAAAAQKIGELLDVLQIDHRNDHNTRDTPMRVAKMYVTELLRGRFSAPPKITDELLDLAKSRKPIYLKAKEFSRGQIGLKHVRGGRNRTLRRRHCL